MFLSVIVAYVIAATFAFCGAAGAVHYIMEAPEDMGYFPFIEGLAVAMWPLAFAVALLVLVQIATKLERWMLLWTLAQAPTPAGGRPIAPRHPAPKPAPAPSTPAPQVSYFGTVTPPLADDTLPAAPSHPEPEAQEEAPVPQPARPAEEQKGLSFFKLD